ncbi:MAG: AAA family ATPase [Elusimicrobia bacterium CG11_big_fil_rev_8_21_14_0_20_64_6]|nr:MAG: AAA family ATPase [Elusimicrobia bacterium CG11_big_fil_rev_8_21_14_0_20_64_6]
MSESQDDVKKAEHLRAARALIVEQLGRVIVGQEGTVEEVLIALFARGHCLLQGVPGLAKTLLVTSLARILDLQSSRVQFTPDLMPSDVTGTEILQEDPVTRARSLRFVKGPVFANFVLADEINRTPPKTQAALLQAMQEGQVTAGSQTLALPKPFFVMATQNPIEQEGTYPLPEAQLDRFFLQSLLGYPTLEEETRIVTETTGAALPDLKPVLTAAEVLELQELVRRVPVPEPVVAMAVRLVRSTRPKDELASDSVKQWVSWGASPRASQALVLGAKARALLEGRLVASAEDLVRVARPVLRHRLVLNYQAEAEGVLADDLIGRLLDAVA